MSERVFQQHSDVWIAKAAMRTDDGTEWILNYYLQSFEGREGGIFYGLRVDKSTPEGVLAEREETLALTENRSRAVAVGQAFAAGVVPPSVLLEMADEWLSEQDSIWPPT